MRLQVLILSLFSLSLAASCHGEEECEVQYDQYDRAPVGEPLAQRDPMTGLCETFGWGGGGGGGTGTGSCDDNWGPEETEAGAPIAIPDWGVCDQFCETLTEADCLQADECRGVYNDNCLLEDQLPGGVCEREYKACWAITPTGPYSDTGCDTYGADECARHNECAAVHNVGTGNFSFCTVEPEGTTIPNPGTCDPATCESVPPECPDTTVPGVLNGCWTGYCIPLDQCDSLPACSIQDEASCVGRGDCQPLYEGVGCDCTGDSCVCEDWLYRSCEQAPQF